MASVPSSPPSRPSEDGSNPCPTYERLRHTIAKRVRMSPIDQPLMLMELLSRGFAGQQSARAQRRTWPG